MTHLQATDVTIIGAGLTGLSLAHFLQKAGKTVRLVEKQDRPGGVMHSITQKGFTFECGPNTGVASNNAVDELFTDLKDLCTVEAGRPESKARWIWKNGRWNALPSGPISAISTPLFSLKDKFRILGEPFRKKGTNPNESVADMVKRRLGNSYLNYAVDPFISGVYAGDPHYIVTQYALPKLYQLEQNYGSFIKGSIKRGKQLKQERAQRTYNGMFSFKGGMHSLVSALENKVDENNIILNAENTLIQKQQDLYSISTQTANGKNNWESESVVFSSGTSDLSQILPFVDAALFKSIQQLNYAKIVQVAVGFNNWSGIPIAAYGGLIPSIEKRNALGILFPSSIFTNRAPEQGALLSLFLGGFRKPEIAALNDTEIENIVLKEIEETLQVKNPKPDLLSIHKYHSAIPQYGASSKERLNDINTIEKQNRGLYLAGNIRDGIGMADRINQAYNLAKQISG